MQEKSVLEIDEISGNFVIALTDDIVEELEYWEEGDKVTLEVQSTRNGDNVLVVRRI
jgi:hypothetical protein